MTFVIGPDDFVLNTLEEIPECARGVAQLLGVARGTPCNNIAQCGFRLPADMPSEE